MQKLVKKYERNIEIIELENLNKYFNFNFDIYNRVCNIWVKILSVFQNFV